MTARWGRGIRRDIGGEGRNENDWELRLFKNNCAFHMVIHSLSGKEREGRGKLSIFTLVFFFFSPSLPYNPRYPEIITSLRCMRVRVYWVVWGLFNLKEGFWSFWIMIRNSTFGEIIIFYQELLWVNSRTWVQSPLVCFFLINLYLIAIDLLRLGGGDCLWK